MAIDDWPDEGDRRALTLGLEACAKFLFAAPAQFVPSHSAIVTSTRGWQGWKDERARR